MTTNVGQGIIEKSLWRYVRSRRFVRAAQGGRQKTIAIIAVIVSQVRLTTWTKTAGVYQTTRFEHAKYKKHIEEEFFRRLYHVSKEQFRMIRDIIRQLHQRRLQRPRRYDNVVAVEVILCVTMWIKA